MNENNDLKQTGAEPVSSTAGLGDDGRTKTVESKWWVVELVSRDRKDVFPLARLTSRDEAMSLARGFTARVVEVVVVERRTVICEVSAESPNETKISDTRSTARDMRKHGS